MRLLLLGYNFEPWADLNSVLKLLHLDAILLWYSGLSFDLWGVQGKDQFDDKKTR